MGNNSRTIGKWGEEKALEYLLGKGYTLVVKGFRSRFGEIDMIMKNKEYLTFVEVKTRKNSGYGYAREYVSQAKQRKIVSTAQYYLMKEPTMLQPRFDVIEVYAQQGISTPKPDIEHIENAFDS